MILAHYMPASAQVLLRWATQRDIAVVPKSNSVARLAENLDCNSFHLDEQDIQNLSSLNINLRVRRYIIHATSADTI